jgi:hypothetical protein
MKKRRVKKETQGWEEKNSNGSDSKWAYYWA